MDGLVNIFERFDQVEPGETITAVCDDIKSRHPDRVLAFVYYGSSLREMNNPDKMLDFYVVVDSYRKTHRNPVRAMLNAVIPPAVYYHEMMHKNGQLTTCKYSIISIKAFERRSTSSAYLSTVWGRFSQPCVVLFPKTNAVYHRIMAARAAALRHIMAETAPLFEAPTTTTEFFGRGFRESYRTELRPEASDARSREIVERYLERYKAVMAAVYGAPDSNGKTVLPATGSKLGAKLRWAGRRILGKPMTAVRLINNAATFDGGLDYVLRKLHNHSGVTIEPTPFQRKHPVMCAPILGWKLWRKGAFR